MITHYFRTVKDEEIKILDAPRSGIWTHVVKPTDEEIDFLVRELALDRVTLEDARDFFEVPRMEKSGGVTYFFTRYPFDQEEEDVDTAPLMIAMGESFVLTVSPRQVPQFKPFIEGREAVHTTQKAKLFIQMMTAITVSFEQRLIKLRRSVHKDRAQLRHIGNKEIVRFVNYEHQLSDFVSAVVPTTAWLNQVTTGNYMQLYSEDLQIMEDLMIDNSQLVESARSVLKTIQNVRNATEAILTNNLNATIRTLTVLTILLTIPTIVASLYGMNIPLPLSSHPYGFWLVLVFIGMVVSLVVWLFKRYRWL